MAAQGEHLHPAPVVVPQQNAFIADWAPPSARGRYMGLYQATWSVGFAIAPLLFLPASSGK